MPPNNTTKKIKQRKISPTTAISAIIAVGFFISLHLSYSLAIPELAYMTYLLEIVGTVLLIWKLFKKADRISLHSDLRLWGLRILSGLSVLGGIILVPTAILAFSTSEPSVGANVVFLFFALFGIGLVLLGAYTLFKFKKRTGVIIYQG